MKKQTYIRWANYSWNPYGWFCSKTSAGCANCYMFDMAARFNRPHPHLGADHTMPTRWEAAMKELSKIPAGSVLFVNSMSDTFHANARQQDIHRIFNTALARPDLTFLVLTKRPERAYYMRDYLPWPSNLWLGASVEHQATAWRLDYLLKTPAAGHFVSAEPLIEDVAGVMAPYMKATSAYRGIGWLIVGGESGDRRRKFDKAWARSLRDLSTGAGVPFMFKQGSARKSEQDKVLDGREWSETPFLLEKKVEAVA